MRDWLQWLESSGFMPHGHCYLWLPSLVFLEVLSNAAIGLAYLSISVTLAVMVRRARELPFQWVYLAFGVFIVACGFTHFMDVWVIWRPNYWLDATIRCVTAVASVGTAVLLFPLFPKVMALADAARTMRARGLRLEQLNAEVIALYEGAREALAEAIPQLVWTATPTGEIDFVNRRWVDYFGARPEPGWQFTEVLHPEDVASFAARWKTSLESGVPLEVECRLRGRNGEHRWFLVRAMSVSNGGRAVRWFGTATDIHEQRHLADERERALESTREAVRARDMFLAVAAHELRTPLTPLRLELESLDRAARARRLARLEPEAVADRCGAMVRHLTRLDRLVGDLLDVTRIAAGRIDLELCDVDLGEVVREVLDRHAKEIERAGCALTVRTEPGLVGRWDRARVDQVITNLITNATKYGARQPILVEARAVDGRARLEVQDHGIGVAPEYHQVIFERFERGAAKGHYAGLGLGLWIVREIVRALGGAVGVESALGEGATFHVELPLGPGHRQTPTWSLDPGDGREGAR